MGDVEPAASELSDSAEPIEPKASISRDMTPLKKLKHLACRNLPWILLLATGCVTSPGPDIKSATVKLIALDLDTMKVAESSGFFVRADGMLVTCRHAVHNKELLAVILADGSRRQVIGLVNEDAEHDLALLRIKGNGFTPLPVSGNLPVDGRPLRASTKFSVDDARYLGQEQGLIVFTCPSVREGSSGGVLVDGGGEVVGIICGAFDDRPDECVAVPTSHALPLLQPSLHSRGD